MCGPSMARFQERVESGAPSGWVTAWHREGLDGDHHAACAVPSVLAPTLESVRGSRRRATPGSDSPWTYGSARPVQLPRTSSHS